MAKPGFRARSVRHHRGQGCDELGIDVVLTSRLAPEQKPKLRGPSGASDVHSHWPWPARRPPPVCQQQVQPEDGKWVSRAQRWCHISAMVLGAEPAKVQWPAVPLSFSSWYLSFPFLMFYKVVSIFSGLKLISISPLSTRFKLVRCSLVTATWHLYHMLQIGGKVILEIKYEDKWVRGRGMKKQGQGAATQRLRDQSPAVKAGCVIPWNCPVSFLKKQLVWELQTPRPAPCSSLGGSAVVSLLCT